MKFIRLKPDLPETHILVDGVGDELGKLRFKKDMLFLKVVEADEFVYQVFFPQPLDQFRSEEERKYYKRMARQAYEKWHDNLSWEVRVGMYDPYHSRRRRDEYQEALETVFPPGFGRLNHAGRSVAEEDEPVYRAVDPINLGIGSYGFGGAAGSAGQGGGGGGYATVTTGGTLTEATMRRAVEQLRQGMEGEPTPPTLRSELERRASQSRRDAETARERARMEFRGINAFNAGDAVRGTPHDRPEGSGEEIRGRAVTDSTDTEVTYVTAIDPAL